MKVMKFGGTSVNGAPEIERVFEIVHRAAANGKIAVVVSALGGVTDELIRIANLAVDGRPEWPESLEGLKFRHIRAVEELIADGERGLALCNIDSFFYELSDTLRGLYPVGKLPKNCMDFIMSFGERLSALILSEVLNSRGLEAEPLDARHVIQTDDNFGNAAVDTEASYGKIRDYFEGRAALQVITGFIGATADGAATTLGRNGSDYTAALFGAALGATAVQIWKDVPGVMSADPRIVPDATVLPRISYEEMYEMAFGAKVLNPATMDPCVQKKIPIFIRNTFDPDSSGTLIGPSVDEGASVKGVTVVENVTLLKVIGTRLRGMPGSAERMFRAIRLANANVILNSQPSSERAMCAAVKSDEAAAAISSLRDEFKKEIENGTVALGVLPDHAIVAVVGDGMKGVPNSSGRFFTALGENCINISASAQADELSISAAVAAAEINRAVNAVHKEFFRKKVTHRI